MCDGNCKIKAPGSGLELVGAGMMEKLDTLGGSITDRLERLERAMLRVAGDDESDERHASKTPKYKVHGPFNGNVAAGTRYDIDLGGVPQFLFRHTGTTTNGEICWMIDGGDPIDVLVAYWTGYGIGVDGWRKRRYPRMHKLTCVVLTPAVNLEFVFITGDIVYMYPSGS